MQAVQRRDKYDVVGIDSASKVVVGPAERGVGIPATLLVLVLFDIRRKDPLVNWHDVGSLAFFCFAPFAHSYHSEDLPLLAIPLHPTHPATHYTFASPHHRRLCSRLSLPIGTETLGSTSRESQPTQLVVPLTPLDAILLCLISQ